MLLKKKPNHECYYITEDWLVHVVPYEKSDHTLIWCAKHKVYQDKNDYVGKWETFLYGDTIFEIAEKLGLTLDI